MHFKLTSADKEEAGVLLLYYFAERLTSFCHTLEKYGRLQASGGWKQNFKIFSLYSSLATRKGPFIPTALSPSAFPSWSGSQPVCKLERVDFLCLGDWEETSSIINTEREAMGQGRNWEESPNSSQEEQRFLFAVNQLPNEEEMVELKYWYFVTSSELTDLATEPQ